MTLKSPMHSVLGSWRARGSGLYEPPGAIPPLWSIRGKYGAVGVDGVTSGCVAHYQPKQDALGQIVPTVLTQYRNWANPGTWDATLGTAPAFDPAVGWTFTAASLHYLLTGIVPAAGWSMVVRFSGAPTTAADCCAAGINIRAVGKRLSVFSRLMASDNHAYGYGSGVRTVAPRLAAGTMGNINGARCDEDTGEQGENQKQT